MRKELRRYSSIGNRDGILLFCSKVLTGEWEDLSSIKTSCSFILGANISFTPALMLFEDLGVLIIQKNKCISNTIKFEKETECSFIRRLCDICIRYLLEEHLIDKDSLKYEEETGRFYVPTSAFNLDSSILRNLLKELSAFVLEGTHFFISPEFEHLFKEAIRKKKVMSQEDLLKKIEEEQLMGEDGELYVMDYERRRLNVNQQHIKDIKQISSIDVSAGYDIISFHDESLNNRRYIEVKTYNGIENFFWSINEMKSAKLRGEDYYLYLVNHSKIKEEGYAPLMIKDPFFQLQKDDSWRATPESFHVERVYKKQDDVIKHESIANDVQHNIQSMEDNDENKEKIVILPSYQPNCIPLYSLRAACGSFEENETPEVEGWIDVSGHGFTPDNKQYFVIRAKGKSMLPQIKDGDFCVFEWYQGGERSDKIVLMECPSVDNDYGCKYTIKTYYSEKRWTECSWQHTRIQLRPLNDKYSIIELNPETQYRTVGVFKCVL